MEKLQLRLVLTGLVIILAGFIYGMVHTLAVDHAPRMSLRDDYKAALARLADNGLNHGAVDSAIASIDIVSTRTVEYQRAIGAHTHWIYLGMLVIILGLLLDIILAGSRHAAALAAALGAGVVIYPMGLAAQAAGFVLAGEALALLGSLLVIGTILALTASLFRRRS